MPISSTLNFTLSLLAVLSTILVAGLLLFGSLPSLPAIKSISLNKVVYARLSEILNQKGHITVPRSSECSGTLNTATCKNISAIPSLPSAGSSAVNPGCVSRRLQDYKPNDSGYIYSHPSVVQYAKLSAHNLAVNLTFMDYMALLSAHKFLKPERIIILTYADIFGRYWDLTQKWETISVEMKKVERIRKIGGKNASHFIEHHADFIKLQSLLESGGIISDFDVVIVNGTKLKNMQRMSECVLSQERSVLNVGFISCIKNSSFIQKWLDTYHEKYHPKDFLKNSAVYPKQVLEKNDTCYNVYVVDGIASGPTYDGYQEWLTKDGVNWEAKVAAHYFNKKLKAANESVLGQDHSFADMLRYVVNS